MFIIQLYKYIHMNTSDLSDTFFLAQEGRTFLEEVQLLTIAQQIYVDKSMQTDLDDSLEQTIVCNNNKLILSTVEFVSKFSSKQRVGK